jgi:2-polyprenyl-3-methyl-5-hydroxy-6-metoxy-1,4-benzoquinol methylase
MKSRINLQEKFIEKYFRNNRDILDIGCGFGRQAFLLAKKGFSLVGIDTSEIFISIAKRLFDTHHYSGTFYCADILSTQLNQTFNQILILDVLEHVVSSKRKKFFEKIHSLTEEKGLIILSLPHVKKRFSSQLNNRIRKLFTQYLHYFRNREEHPFPIPQKGEILKLTRGRFSVIDFLETADTDYYVLEKYTI